MDNITSQPALVPPTVPADFDAAAGNSKSDLTRAIFALLASSKITGIQASEPNPFDLGTLAGQVASLQAAVDKIVARTPRRVVMAGIVNGIVIVPFPDIGTTDYQVDVAFVSPNTDLPDSLMWSIIKNSKSSNQVSLRINGNAAAMDLEITITPMNNI